MSASWPASMPFSAKRAQGKSRTRRKFSAARACDASLPQIEQVAPGGMVCGFEKAGIVAFGSRQRIVDRLEKIGVVAIEISVAVVVEFHRGADCRLDGG